jgi:hypothetical protein
MAIKNNFKKIGILLVLGVVQFSCKNNKMEEKFEWSSSISGPQETPMHVIDGVLTGGDNFYGFDEMNGESIGGWGYPCTGMSQITAVIPDTLSLTWFSLTERKFYTGLWSLPKERIKKFFKEGYRYNTFSDPNTKKRETFSIIQIGIAPKGAVFVWISGSGPQIEVARLQGHETVVTVDDVDDNTKYMFDKDYVNNTLTNPFTITSLIKEKIEKEGYPSPDVYDVYREKYSWKPKIILPEGYSVYYYDFEMCNGEKETTQSTIDMKIDQRAIPYSFMIVFKDKSGQQYISRIAFTQYEKFWEDYLKDGTSLMLPLDFDKNEIRTIFKDKITKNSPAELVFKIDPIIELKSERVTSLYLEQAGKQYPIKERITRTGKY